MSESGLFIQFLHTRHMEFLLILMKLLDHIPVDMGFLTVKPVTILFHDPGFHGSLENFAFFVLTVSYKSTIFIPFLKLEFIRQAEALKSHPA
ncbi:hypothetical protein ACFSQ7_28880 [Paenibacillus rhizoplanae]